MKKNRTLLELLIGVVLVEVAEYEPLSFRGVRTIFQGKPIFIDDEAIFAHNFGDAFVDHNCRNKLESEHLIARDDYIITAYSFGCSLMIGTGMVVIIERDSQLGACALVEEGVVGI